MTSDNARALEQWLAAQPIGDELNEMVAPMSIMAGAMTAPDPTKELANDQHL